MTEGGHGATPLTPEEEALVSRLLADAAGPVPMPPEVRERLDDVLTGLAEERDDHRDGHRDGQHDVVPLRARRRWPRVLLAAAAVVIGGYTVGTVATQGTLTGSEDAMSGAADAGDAEEAPTASMLTEDEAAQDGSTADKDRTKRSDKLAGAPVESLSQGYAAIRLPVRLRSDRLDVGVRRALGVLERNPGTELTLESADQTCLGPELAEEERSLPVRYDGVDAVLVAGPERSGTVEVTVSTCAGDELESLLVRP